MKQSLDFYKQHLSELVMCGLTMEEQETHILVLKTEPELSVETTDPVTFRDLRKKVLAGDWELTHVDAAADNTDPLSIVAAVFKAPKSLITFRTAKQVLTPEQRARHIESLKSASKTTSQLAEKD
nr:MAG TPA: hypothetical protein [Caudoviricetes sp.]